MKALIRYLAFLFLIVCSLSARAVGTSIDMYGAISYSYVGNVVNIQVANIQNTDFTYISGSLHLRMSATSTPTFDGSAYLLADIDLNYINGTGQLSPGESFTGISVDTAFAPPPNGTYYIHLYVSEYPNLSTALDFHTFSSVEKFGPVILIPAAPTALSVTSVTTSTANISWQDNSGVETGYKIERSTSPASGFTQVGTVGVNGNSFSATGLSSSTTYYFRVQAYNSAGSSVYSNTATGVTQASTSSSSGGGGGAVGLLSLVLLSLLGFTRRKA